MHEVRAAWRIEQLCECPLAAAATAAEAALETAYKAAPWDTSSMHALSVDIQRAEAIRVLLIGLSVVRYGDEHQRQETITASASSAAASSASGGLLRPDCIVISSSEEDDEEANEHDGHYDCTKCDARNLRAHFDGAFGPRPTNRPTTAQLFSYRRRQTDAELRTEVAVRQRGLDDAAIRRAQRHRQIPGRIMTLFDSTDMYAGVPHVWHCNGRLLVLLQSANQLNVHPFREQWKRGQPVVVANVHRHLNPDLWSPASFARDYGHERSDLLISHNGGMVANQPMLRFWRGFDADEKRMRDAGSQRPLLLKIKDWPTAEDFAVTMPPRYADLMQHMPLGEYTRRDGVFNLVSHLPDGFMRPDLGPKMYNAYGSAAEPDVGTTNLHLDVSDAVNVLAWVSVGYATEDVYKYQHKVQAVYEAVDEAGLDALQLERVREPGMLVGALWHIYHRQDAEKIRTMLRKVAAERGETPMANDDPIHDQSSYLNGSLRERLYREYAVEGYAIAQCLGDAVFIPAGAPHQVWNLHNCIKLAEDFVSPENLMSCAELALEFRQLSAEHANHEDKLQVKSVLYHAVKDAVGTLEGLVAERLAHR